MSSNFYTKEKIQGKAGIRRKTSCETRKNDILLSRTLREIQHTNHMARKTLNRDIVVLLINIHPFGSRLFKR